MSQHNIGTHIRNHYENEYVKLGIYNFEIVKDCTYIGKILTSKTEPRPEIKKNTNANRAYYALLPPLESQSVPRAEEIKIYDINKTSGYKRSRILDFE